MRRLSIPSSYVDPQSNPQHFQCPVSSTNLARVQFLSTKNSSAMYLEHYFYSYYYALFTVHPSFDYELCVDLGTSVLFSGKCNRQQNHNIVYNIYTRQRLFIEQHSRNFYVYYSICLHRSQKHYYYTPLWLLWC